MGVYSVVVYSNCFLILTLCNQRINLEPTGDRRVNTTYCRGCVRPSTLVFLLQTVFALSLWWKISPPSSHAIACFHCLLTLKLHRSIANKEANRNQILCGLREGKCCH